MINIKRINIYYFLFDLLQINYSSKRIHSKQHCPRKIYITKIATMFFSQKKSGEGRRVAEPILVIRTSVSTLQRSKLPWSIVVAPPPTLVEGGALWGTTKLFYLNGSPDYWFPLPRGLGSRLCTWESDDSPWMQKHPEWAKLEFCGISSKSLMRTVWSPTSLDCVCWGSQPPCSPLR